MKKVSVIVLLALLASIFLPAQVMAVGEPQLTVNPTSIDFGTLIPGQTSSVYNITVTNVGTHEVDVSVELDISSADLFKNNLEMRYDSSGGFSTGSGDPVSWGTLIPGLDMYTSDYVQTQLPVPSGYTPDNVETGQLTFTATGT